MLAMDNLKKNQNNQILKFRMAQSSGANLNNFCSNLEHLI